MVEGRTPKNFYHQEILKELKKLAGKNDLPGSWTRSYLGTNKRNYFIKTVLARLVIKNFIKTYRQLEFNDFLKLVDSLYQGSSTDETYAASRLINYWPDFRRKIELKKYGEWLLKLEGWCEIDTLCQSTFTAKEILDNWNGWKKMLTEFSKSSDIQKIRASLVMLCRAVRESSDPRLARVALANIDRLKGEKEVLVTKAISWLLRDLIKHHRNQVLKYITKNKDTLPKIAIRETQIKLLTGKKTKRSK